jgi:hypothetical protein
MWRGDRRGSGRGRMNMVGRRSEDCSGFFDEYRFDVLMPTDLINSYTVPAYEGWLCGVLIEMVAIATTCVA